jgi:hypothetical protein
MARHQKPYLMFLQQIPTPLEGLLIDLELLRSRAELPPLFDNDMTAISLTHAC